MHAGWKVGSAQVLVGRKVEMKKVDGEDEAEVRAAH